MPELNGGVVIVTGASSGIGRATAELFARRGARVVASDLDDEGGRETVRRIESAGGTAAYVRADVSSPGECEALVECWACRRPRPSSTRRTGSGSTPWVPLSSRHH